VINVNSVVIFSAIQSNKDFKSYITNTENGNCDHFHCIRKIKEMHERMVLQR